MPAKQPMEGEACAHECWICDVANRDFGYCLVNCELFWRLNLAAPRVSKDMADTDMCSTLSALSLEPPSRVALRTLCRRVIEGVYEAREFQAQGKDGKAEIEAEPRQTEGSLPSRDADVATGSGKCPLPQERGSNPHMPGLRAPSGEQGGLHAVQSC